MPVLGIIGWKQKKLTKDIISVIIYIMIYKFFRYWFLLIAVFSSYHFIKLYYQNIIVEVPIIEGLGHAVGMVFISGILLLLFLITLISLVLAIFVARPKKVSIAGSGGVPQNSGPFSNSGEMVKVSILGVSFVISAYFIIGSFI